VGVSNHYETSPARAALALLAGAVTGGVTTVAMLLAAGGSREPIAAGPFAVVAVFGYASIVWAAGLLIVAALPWALLHYYGWRSWRSAVGLGVVLIFVVSFALMTSLTQTDWREAGRLSAMFSAAGGVVGLVVWGVAYRRVRPTAAADRS
jgi:MFS family permease